MPSQNRGTHLGVFANTAGFGELLAIRKILCPLDFSEFSQRAFGYAACLARRFGAQLILQHTVEPAQYVFFGMGPEAVRPNPGKQLQLAREAIRDMLAASQLDPSSVTVLLNQGNVSTRIFQTISNEPIDLVVMGTHGRKGFNHLLLGSVTEGVVHQATCPVLAVSRPRRTLSANCPDGMDLKTIVLATDFRRIRIALPPTP